MTTHNTKCTLCGAPMPRVTAKIVSCSECSGVCYDADNIPCSACDGSGFTTYIPDVPICDQCDAAMSIACSNDIALSRLARTRPAYVRSKK